MSGQGPGFAFGRTVTVHRAGPPGRDAYGNDVPGPAVEDPVDGCAVYPAGGSTEITGGRDTVADTVHVLLPAGVVVRATDRLAVDGLRYEVHGPPQRFHSPFTGASVALVTARRTTG